MEQRSPHFPEAGCVHHLLLAILGHSQILLALPLQLAGFSSPGLPVSAQCD